jgi:dihydropteroate synthase
MPLPAAPSSHPFAWVHARGLIGLDVPRVMAVVNLTPDSFFDGGSLMPPGGEDPNAGMAVRLCRGLVQQGADLLDLGGESTRPGSEPLAPGLELRRVLPVLRRLQEDPELAQVPISVDTRHAEVAAAAMAAGAAIINDVSGLADPAMAEVAARTGAGLVLGHLRGEPTTMQQSIHFQDLLAEVAEELIAVVERALRAGVANERIVVDPGVGFGKTAEQSAALVAASAFLARETGCPVLIGASRKNFLGAITGRPVGERMIGSVAAAVVAVERGASIVRVHDVAATAEALRVAAAVRRAYSAATDASRRGSA